MPLQTLPCRAFQRGFALGARLLPWRTPTVLCGAGSLLKLPDVFSREGASRPLVVASRRQCADERFLALRAALEGRGVRPSVFSGVEPDPSVATVEKLAAQYRADGCDSFLVLGGGSPIDAAKVAAARVVRPDKTVARLGGLLKVRRPLPLFIAVPTTAGTGSEATIAAVVTGEEHRKYAVSDLCLIPRYAVLDPTLTLSLPPAVTAQTGMDALTHAVEAYLSLYYNTRETRALAESAVRDIFRYLPVACRDGQSTSFSMAVLNSSAAITTPMQRMIIIHSMRVMPKTNPAMTTTAVAIRWKLRFCSFPMQHRIPFQAYPKLRNCFLKSYFMDYSCCLIP